jgi:hypothetical protein
MRKGDDETDDHSLLYLSGVPSLATAGHGQVGGTDTSDGYNSTGIVTSS